MLHSVIVSYNRLSLTKQTLEAYKNTVSIPHSLIIVDNGSKPEVQDWLENCGEEVLFLGENKFPGYATNRGWERMPENTKYLQRLDNDIKLLPGWCEDMMNAFSDPEVGIYGVQAAGDEEWTWMPVWPVGGSAVISRKVYDEGLRYSEEPWRKGWAEAKDFTSEVWKMGYQRIFSSVPTIEYLDDGDMIYRAETHELRGLEVKPFGEK